MKIQRHLVAFAVGFLFAAGLAIAKMTDPAVVIGFLDIFGDWDPTLVGVMGGGVLVYFVLFRRITDRPRPVLADVFRIPERTELTPSLLIGSAMFGIGWGIAGYCPGPLVTVFGTAALPGSPGDIDKVVLLFVSMIVGMIVFRIVDHFILSRPADERLVDA